MAMTYDAFLDQMKKDLEAGFAEDLPAKYSQVKIGIRDVEKLQGESYRGISFRVGDAPIEGNLNMQQAYQAHEAGVPYESILRDTQEAIMQQVDRMPQFNIGEISDYESMKANLMMELIPQKGNEERLAEVPHQKVEDMALIYRMDMGDSPGGKMTSVVTNQNMLAYGISPCFAQEHERGHGRDDGNGAGSSDAWRTGHAGGDHEGFLHGGFGDPVSRIYGTGGRADRRRFLCPAILHP